jgi:gamma-glutamylaminecyclotransferase
MTDLYFSYGSNCLQSRLLARCPGAVLSCNAVLKHYELGWWSRRDGAVRTTIRPVESKSCEGILWSNCDMGDLDKIEGNGVVYERVSVTVDTHHGKLSAYTYIAIEGPHGSPGEITELDAAYIKAVVVGRAQFGFATPKVHLVAVYGSLMSGFHNHHVMSHGFHEYIETTRIKGFQLHDLGHFPGATPNESSSIEAEIWLVDDATLARLDQLEGHPTFYRRQTTTTASGVKVSVYILNESRQRTWEPIVPSGSWAEYKTDKPQSKIV